MTQVPSIIVPRALPAIVRRITAAQSRAFAQATQAQAPAGSAAAPMAAVILTLPHGVARVMRDPACVGDVERLARAVHLEESIIWHRAVPTDSPMQIRPRLQRTAVLTAGEAYYIDTALCDASGALCVETSSTVLIRERHRGVSRPRQRTEPLRDTPFREQVAVAADQPERYARASGDSNPIHLDDAVAQKVGLRGRVLHGLCTLAHAHRLAHQARASRAQTLRKLGARFSRPVYPGDVLCWRAFWESSTRLRFDMQNTQGVVVLADGLAEFNEGV